MPPTHPPPPPMHSLHTCMHTHTHARTHAHTHTHTYAETGEKLSKTDLEFLFEEVLDIYIVFDDKYFYTCTF